jgi:hypothetical protein
MNHLERPKLLAGDEQHRRAGETRAPVDAARSSRNGRRAGGFRLLAGLACLWLASAGAACSAFIDQELSGKTGGSGGAGGADTDGGTTTTTAGGSGGQSTVATGAGGECTGSPDCGCPAGCALAHATATCAMGECQIVECEWGFNDCNHDRLDGCEADLKHDDQNCGKCDHQCSQDGESCKEGKCD